ncbi:mitochondrial carrier domain-containing protein [Tuber indicum]|nr:mitochondrial carrier domain-containing protein [Tuber indicum]
MSTLSEKPALPSKETVKQEIQQDIQAIKSPSLSGLRSLVAGGVGGVFAVISGHPFDLVKVRLQTAEKGVYSGAFDVVRKTAAREGMVRGLYAGVSAPLIGVTPMFAVSFWGYDVGKNLVRRFATVNSNQMSIAQISFAGFFSAIPMTLITAPFERVKVLLQIQGQTGEKKYSGGMDVVRQLYKEGGIRSVFRGSAATLARDGPGSAAYFATYEYIKRRLTPEGEGKLSMGAVMVAGGAAGMAMWLLVFPVDTVKSRLQSAQGKPTIGSVVREIHGRGGFKAFFPGLGPALARSVPANSMCFLGVELAHKLMDKTFG